MIVGDKIQCNGCDTQIPNHRWGKIKAEGWLFRKDGTAWCPDHLPEWVVEWRKQHA